MNYAACKNVLTHLKNEIKALLKENFIGAYVHGSLATGDFTDFSDVDMVIIIDTNNDISALKHYGAGQKDRCLIKSPTVGNCTNSCSLFLRITLLPFATYLN